MIARPHTDRLSRLQPILLRLREKAHCAFSAVTNDPTGASIYDGSLWNLKAGEDDDELDIFAGRTTVINCKRPSPGPVHLAQPTASQHDSAPPLITPPTALPIAPIPGSNGGGITLREAWPSQSSSSGGAHHYQSQTAHPPLHAQQASYQISLSHPHSQHSHSHSHSSHSHSHPHPHQHQHGHSHPDQPGYQWVGQHSPSLTPPAQAYGAPQLSPAGHGHGHFPSAAGFAPAQAPAAGAGMLQQRYAGAGYPPSAGQPQPQQQQPSSQQQQQQQAHYAPPQELVNLGLASRHGRLDERWTSFMHENGFL